MILRRATEKDAPFIALAVMEALGDDIMERIQANNIGNEDRHSLDLITGVVRRTDTLYSWQNTLVAEADNGILLGAMVSYPGDNYLEMRDRTFSLLGELITFDVSAMDAETVPGEYYLDSLAVAPSARGKGVGRKLLCAARDEAFAMSLPAILACAPDNIGAKKMYEAMGFRQDGEMFIFGHPYLRMVSENKSY